MVSNPDSPKAPTDHTTSLLSAAAISFDGDPADFERAERGLIATHTTGLI